MNRDTATRRTYLRTAAAASLVGLGSVAGCLESRSPYAPPIVSNRPDAVYVPSHFEGMAPVGMDTDGPVAGALVYSYPHRFWLVSGTDRSRVRIQPDDTLHLMLQLWDRESGIPLSGTSPRIRITDEDGVVADRVFWPMLSQRMGFHYGDNVQLDGDGPYRVEVSVPPTGDHLVGDLADRLDRGAVLEAEFDWASTNLEELAINTIEDERAGSRGALPAMTGMPGPTGLVPETLPGRRLGTATIDELGIGGSVVPTAGEAAQAALVVTIKTPHNGFAMPMLGPVATVDGTRHRLQAALDPALGMHYRASLGSEAVAGPIEIRLPAPSQVARHEGYETAFMQPGTARLTDS